MGCQKSLNRIYRLIYSRVLNAWVAVSEITRGQGKGGQSARRLTLLVAGLALVPMAEGMPTGGKVTSGSGAITQSGATMSIQQGSQNLGLSWTGFNIGSNETVNFVQPNASAVAVNRITSTLGSTIMGHLNANGQVYLIDPNGILFGKGAEVNVGGLVASTLDVTGVNGNSVMFGGSGNGKVTNQGTITAVHGGYVALLGHQVLNEGVVTAQLGSVVLTGGSAVTLTFNGSQVGVVVTQSQLNDLARNGGILQADGGNIVLTAGAKDALLASAVNNSGLIEADTISNKAGHIQLLSGMSEGTTGNSGTLSAAAPNGGNGGFIETSGHTVSIGSQSVITTKAANGLNGTWLIDPNDFTIAASGGDITGLALSTALGSNSVTIQTSGTTVSCTGATCGTGTAGSGNINVNDTVNWSSGSMLTLSAYNNINVNSALNVTGAGTLSLLYGQSAANAGNGAVYNVNAPINLASTAHFITKLGNDTTGAATSITWTIVDSIPNPILQQGTGMTLSQMLAALSGNYALGSNMDATPTHSWNGNTGPTPIGVNTMPFTGIFDGLDHVVSNYTINQPTASYIGLFGYVGPGAIIRNVGLTGVTVSGGYFVGSLVGYNNGGTLSNDYATGTVSGTNNIGGLVGLNKGMVGSDLSTLINDHAAVSVSGSQSVGGLVGANYGMLSNDYATGAVTRGSYAGGLVGENYGGTVSNDYASGAVSGSSGVGGLVGENFGGMLSNDYAMGVVSGFSGSGGLVGINNGTLNTDYATGAVSGFVNKGGLVGINSAALLNGTLINDYYDTTTTGQTQGVAGTADVSGQVKGLTTTQMQSASNFLNFSFTTTPGAAGNNWVMVDVNGTLNNAGGALGATFPMLASEYSTTINNAHQLQLMVMNLGGGYTLGSNIDASSTETVLKDVWSTTGGFVPVGNPTAPFSGIFDGLGHTISNLTINQPAESNVGLFGNVSAATISNTGLLGGSVSGINFVGSLVGYDNASAVRSSYATSAVTGTGTYVGGLVGDMVGGTVSSDYATGVVTGTGTYVGGLVGYNGGTLSNNFYDTTTTGQTQGVGGAADVAGQVWGMTTAQMQIAANFTSATAANGNVHPGWDFTTPVWGYRNGFNGNLPVLCLFSGCSTLVYVNPTGSGSSIYGTAPISVGYTLVNSNGSSASLTNVTLGGTATYAGEPTATSNVGSYSVTYSGGLTLTGTGAPNYVFQPYSIPLAWTVNPLALTGSIAPGSSVYGSALNLGAVTFTNELSGNQPTGIVAINTTGNTSSSGKLKANGYTGIEFISGLSGGVPTDYTYAGITGNYTVTPLVLTGAVIASGSNVYGGSVTPGAVSFTNVVGTDQVSTVVTIVSSSVNQSSSNHLDVGSYNQTLASGLTGADAGNYRLAAFTTATPNYTVSPLALTAAIASGSNVYGSTVTPGAVNFTNRVGSDQVSTTIVATVVSTASNHSSSGHLDSGSYNQTVAANGLTGVDAGNYTFAGFTTPTANYTVTLGFLTYAANSASAMAGSSLPALTGTVTGFVTGDDVANATTGTLMWTSPATASSLPGSYAIDGSGLLARNYAFGQSTGNATALMLNAVPSNITSDAMEETSYQQVFQQGAGQSGPVTEQVVMNPQGTGFFVPAPYQVINGGVNVGQ